MNQLSADKRKAVVASLVEGNSVRATCRIAGVAKGTVLKLLEDIGYACDQFQDAALRNLECKNIQCDEIWSFCYSKDKNVPKEYRGEFGYGDVWTWTAIDTDSKLMVNWHIGRRDVVAAADFMRGLAKRLKNRIQLTTDGWNPYNDAVRIAFKGNVDHAMIQKLYAAEPPVVTNTRYSPSRCVGIRKRIMSGNPQEKNMSTSCVERQNLTMRMGMRRFTRLTNGFSKKVENLGHAVALHFMYYNFCRIHQSLRITPAMAVGISDRVWCIEDLVEMLESPALAAN